MRQDPDKLYRAHLLSVECESPAHRDRRPLREQDPATRAHWTQVALAAAGLTVGLGNDAALYRIARSLLGDDRAGRIPEARAELYWTLITWARMSGAVAEGARAGGPLTADPGALCGALRILGQQTVEVLLGPLLHPGEAEVASNFLRLLGTLGIATGGGGANVRNLDAPAVILTFERISTAYESLEVAGSPCVEARLFRAAADLVRRLRDASRSPTGTSSSDAVLG